MAAMNPMLTTLCKKPLHKQIPPGEVADLLAKGNALWRKARVAIQISQEVLTRPSRAWS